MGLSHQFFFSSRRRHTRSKRDWSSDVCSSDLTAELALSPALAPEEVAGERDWLSSRIQRRRDNAPSRVFDERSEERRVGKKCRTRWSANHKKKRNIGNVVSNGAK